MKSTLCGGLVASTLLFVAAARAQGPSIQPAPIALQHARLVDADDAPRKTILLRAGRIEAILEDGAELPLDARVVDVHGFVVMPAFVDAYTFAGCTTPQPVVDRDIPPKTAADVMIDMRAANRKGIEPAFRAATAFKLEKDASKGYRAQGFGALASSPHGQLLSGVSALATTRETASRDAFLSASVFDTLGLDAPGPGYPGTLMGALAQLRQFFLDAQRNELIAMRRAAGKQGTRTPFDEDFDAVQPALKRARRVLCEADSVNDIERCIKLGDEFGFQIAIAGGREAWRRAPLLRERGIPVFLTLEWGDEPEDPHKKEKQKDASSKKHGPKSDASEKVEPKTESTERPVDEKSAEQKPAVKTDEPKTAEGAVEKPADAKSGDSKRDESKKDKQSEWIYEEPLRVREEKRRIFEETRAGTQVLAAAGVDFAFGSGKSAPKELVERARTLVENGLPLDVAWKALTSGGAELLGVAQNLGRVEKGFDATLAIWSKDPLKTKDAKLGWLVVDGRLYPFDLEDTDLTGKPDEGVDATGAWVFTFDTPDAKPANGDLKMEKDGQVTGTIRFKSPMDDSENSGEFTGHVAGKKFKLDGRVKVGDFEVEVVIDGELDGDKLEGKAKWKFSGGERTREFTAARTPKGGGQ